MLIPKLAKVSIFAVVALRMELVNQMVNGTFMGIEKFNGIQYGIIQIDKIYNSMPPLVGYTYPKLRVRPKVMNF